MPSRKNDLRPDAKGRYRPYLGWKDAEDGVRRHHRFNLGSDCKEAEARMARLRELWAETEKLGGEEPNGLGVHLSDANRPKAHRPR